LGSAPASSQAAGGQTKEITVTGSNFKLEPNAIKVSKGDTVKLTLKDSQGPHALAIPDFNVDVKNGETKTFTVDKAGTFLFG
jgi:cytochrome c oxidase subunit 2